MQSFLDPVILFFLFGVFAGSIKSNLAIPPQISRFLALYLLMALGLKGGFALSKSGFSPEIMSSLLCAVALAVAVPVLGYCVLKRILSGFDAAAVAATYGSVSAVTFITATQFLETHQIAYGGHMAAAMALMESPAILIAIALAGMLRRQQAVRGGLGAEHVVVLSGSSKGGTTLKEVLHEAFTDGTQLLLLGALLIGMLSGEAGEIAMQPFSGDLFKGMLAFFLLDMGLLAARSLAGLKSMPRVLFFYAIGAPLVHACMALILAWICGIGPGNGALLMVLAASASYIAVPAVLRYAITEASPPLYVGLPLAITFPFNIVIGIPFYVNIAGTVLS